MSPLNFIIIQKSIWSRLLPFRWGVPRRGWDRASSRRRKEVSHLRWKKKKELRRGALPNTVFHSYSNHQPSTSTQTKNFHDPIWMHSPTFAVILLWVFSSWILFEATPTPTQTKMKKKKEAKLCQNWQLPKTQTCTPHQDDLQGTFGNGEIKVYTRGEWGYRNAFWGEIQPLVVEAFARVLSIAFSRNHHELKPND